MDINQYIHTGMRREETFIVNEEHSAQHLGSGDVRVLATPMMILFMEQTARRMLGDALPEGHSSVGSHVDVHHLAPTPVGAEVRVSAEVIGIEKNRVSLRVDAWDSQEQVGTGKHLRVIVDETRFMRRVHAKV